MNATEVAIKEAKDNRTREILIIVKESKDLKEAEDKIKALLEK
ncbi:MAG: protein phosphatase [Pseudoleptotrichia goodfellowii]|nr:protein phosphatase [Pseudoleptotrichia goodfellowii]